MITLADRAFTAVQRERLTRVADGLVVAWVVSLPWSTSATGILAILWLIAAAPLFDPAALRRVLTSAPGGLPVLFWALGVAGMLWAGDISFAERLGGLSAFHKLLFIPLLLAHVASRPERARWTLVAFLASCGLLLIVSWALVALPGLPWRGDQMAGIPVKNYSSQADLFTACTFILAALSIEQWRRGRRDFAAACAIAALLFLANILHVATSRTALVAIAVLALAFGYRWFSWRGTLAVFVVAVVCAAAAWTTSSFLRQRVTTVLSEVHRYETEDARTSAGERLEFWKKSRGFVAAAPVIGHGTGSIPDQFRRSASAGNGAASIISSNPHNQTLTVAIQLGIVGVAVLWALWAAHLLLFREYGMAAWAGLLIVVQNVVGSLFNSSLFDFTQGWLYVLGVGIAGGVAFARRERAGEGQAPL